MPSAEVFEASLKRYDPLLSLRWGPCVKAWVIDRKGRVSQALWDVLLWAEQQPNCEPIDRERVISAKLGHRPVLYTPVLGNHVFNELYQADLQEHGTKVVDRHMKRLEDERAKKRNDDTWSRQSAEAIEFTARRRADPSREEQKRIFDEVFDRGISPSKSRRKFNKALLDQHGRPLNEPVKEVKLHKPTGV